MMRQDVQQIISEAFALADQHEDKHDATSHPLVIVPTGFGPMSGEDDRMVETERVGKVGV
jgi:LacI family transcriptional regulator, fructose operon transcriptional repressor